MKLLICISNAKQKNIEAAKKAISRFTSLGYVCVTDEENKKYFSNTDVLPEFLNYDEACKMSDLFVAVGGDGTMLKNSKRAIEYNKPIFGINAGRIGYLSAFDAEKIDELTTQDIEALELSDRILLELTLKSRPNEKYFAVNDVVITRVNPAKSIELSLKYCNNDFASMRSDGIILSTPTGSTAYSFSAGGPVVEPTMNAVIVTPICSHIMFSRSVVLSFNEETPVCVIPTQRDDNTVVVTADGNIIGETDYNDVITVRGCNKCLKLMNSPKRKFYDVLRKDISTRN